MTISSMTFKPVVLIVRDGWGYSPKKKGNAIANAHVPNHNLYMKKYPSTLLDASGNAVGLPAGTQGGSEVGHLTMGAGSIIWQPLELINRTIRDETFFKNNVLLAAAENCKKNNTAFHIMGLFSDQGVHATVAHLYALLEFAKKQKLEKVYLHLFLDGRDVPERSAHKYLLDLNQHMRKIGVGKIASLVGRYYAMDRDTNWDRTTKAYELLVAGKGFTTASAEEGILAAYERGDKTDYYVQPTVIIENGKAVGQISEKDSVVFYNFRSDRTRQMTSILSGKKCPIAVFPRRPQTFFVCFSEYDYEFHLPIAFPQQKVLHNVGRSLSAAGLWQLRIAETEKYAHVTFFFNSQVEDPFPKEDRILVPSPKVASYDLKPEMSAEEITNKAVPAIMSGKYDFVLVNFANADLVGHSGNYSATVTCCAVVDSCVGTIVSAVLKQDGVVLLTGDHGNAEQMLYPNGEPCPAHTTNKVPLSVISNHLKHPLREDGGLQDIGPTILRLLDVEKPAEMQGKSLV